MIVLSNKGLLSGAVIHKECPIFKRMIIRCVEYSACTSVDGRALQPAFSETFACKCLHLYIPTTVEVLYKGVILQKRCPKGCQNAAFEKQHRQHIEKGILQDAIVSSMNQQL